MVKLNDFSHQNCTQHMITHTYKFHTWDSHHTSTWLFYVPFFPNTAYPPSLLATSGQVSLPYTSTCCMQALQTLPFTINDAHLEVKIGPNSVFAHVHISLLLWIYRPNSRIYQQFPITNYEVCSLSERWDLSDPQQWRHQNLSGFYVLVWFCLYSRGHRYNITSMHALLSVTVSG